MTTETGITTTRDEPTLTPFEVIEKVITAGDLATMQPADRIAFYWRVCESLGLNPLTRPFEFISLNGRLTLYARKDATDQLRKINGVSVTNLRRETDPDLGLITVYAAVRDAKGREDESSGIVSVKGLGGEALANAVMKAETKAKRRATLSLVGLGFLDESEVEGQAVEVDPDSGVLIEKPKPKTLLEQVQAQQAILEGDGGQITPASIDRAEFGLPPQDAPGPEAAAEVDVDATTDPVAAPGPSEAAQGLSQADLFAALDENRISREYAAAQARDLWPDRPARQALTDEQRGTLLAHLIGDERE